MSNIRRALKGTRSSKTSRRTIERAALACCETLETRRMLCFAHIPDPGYNGDGEAPQFKPDLDAGGNSKVDTGGLRWSNRGTAANDIDSFNATYGAQAENARNIVQ